MKHVFALLAFVLMSSGLAQVTEISIEVHAQHGSDSSLSGFTTYRVYVECENASDELSAIYGDATSAWTIASSEGFFQSPQGEGFGWNVNEESFTSNPELEFDSWLTIGVSNQNEVAGQPNSVGMGGALYAFEAGDDLVVNSENGGSIFTLYGDENARAGDDLRVLICQLTAPSTAEVSGVINVQLFVGGDQGNALQYEGISFSSLNATGLSGCTDPLSCNYNEQAEDDDGSCLPYDAQSGCTDSSACNFMATALCDDGTCVYPLLEGDCDYGSIACAEGTVWNSQTQQCLPVEPPNPCGEGTIWDAEDEKCVVFMVSDADFDGCVGMSDLLELLTSFGTCMEVPWACGDPLDYQGYDYETVQIGEQCWFAENLQAGTFRNGQDIPLHEASEDWVTEAPARCAPDSSLNLVAQHGWLYNGHVVNDERGVCPSNWHVSTDQNWMELETLVGVADSELSVIGHRCNSGQCAVSLKSSEAEFSGWTGTNATGFSALPSGQRQWAAYNGHGVVSTFWCDESGIFTNFSSCNALLQRGRYLPRVK